MDVSSTSCGSYRSWCVPHEPVALLGLYPFMHDVQTKDPEVPDIMQEFVAQCSQDELCNSARHLLLSLLVFCRASLLLFLLMLAWLAAFAEATAPP